MDPQPQWTPGADPNGSLTPMAPRPRWTPGADPAGPLPRRQFKKAVTDAIMSRRAIRNMNTL